MGIPRTGLYDRAPSPASSTQSCAIYIRDSMQHPIYQYRMQRTNTYSQLYKTYQVISKRCNEEHTSVAEFVDFLSLSLQEIHNSISSNFPVPVFSLQSTSLRSNYPIKTGESTPPIILAYFTIGFPEFPFRRFSLPIVLPAWREYLLA